MGQLLIKIVDNLFEIVRCIVIFRPLEFYKDNEKTPYYWKGKEEFQMEEVLNILQLNVDGDRICSERPLSVAENAAFVVDTRELPTRKDYLEDNIGNFRNLGHCGKVFKVGNNKIVKTRCMERTVKERPPLERDEFLVKVVYWGHKKHKDFKKRTYEVSSFRGEGVFVFVQFLFEDAAHEVSPCKKIRTGESTKQKIRDRVASYKTPSAIYDELFDEGGGLDFKCTSDLPRSIDQIKYERQKIRKKTDVDEMATLLQTAKDNQYIRNLQWTPSPRMVVLTENALQDVVDCCTDPELFTPFTIDTTFNVGAFYVTTTTYKHLKLVDQRSGKHPSLPGPALFHLRQDTGQFLYFAQTLQEVNKNVGDILAIGSDRFKGYANGFASVCPVARVIVCKKHAEDDIDRKLTSLGINGEARQQFMRDIFGRESTKEKGLIDCLSEEEFDAKRLHLRPTWEKREMEARQTSKPEFVHYFDVYIAQEMKEKMILSVRRQAGLGDEFFFDNASESINHRYKVAIRNEKATCNPTGAKDLNCTMAEAGRIYHNMLQQTRRNIHRAVLGLGPYRLAPSFADRQISPSSWQNLSEKEKTARLKWLDPNYKCAKTTATSTVSKPSTKVDPTDPSTENKVAVSIDLTASDLEVNQSTAESAMGPRSATTVNTGNSSLLGEFEITNLPEIFKGSWSNAEKIISGQGIGVAPGITNARVVVSLSSSEFHRVSLDNKGCPTRCDCTRYKDLGLCAHLLAVGYQEGHLARVIRNYQPNISSIIRPSGKAGKKPNQTTRKRKAAPSSSRRDVGEYSDPLDDGNLSSFSPTDKWNVVFVKDTKMRKCYGCGAAVRQNISFEPPSPWNIVLYRREYRIYTPRGKDSLQIATKKENVYYHPRKKCLLEKNSNVSGNAIEVSEAIERSLDDLHRAQLRKEFGLSL